MKKLTSTVVVALVLAGVIIPSAFVHAASTTTPKIAHPTSIKTNKIAHNASLKPLVALRISGTLVSTTANSLTLALSSGHGDTATTTKTYTTDSSTKFSKSGSKVALADLTEGDLIQVMLHQTGPSTYVARTVTDTGLGFASSNAKMNAKMNAVRKSLLLKKK